MRVITEVEAENFLEKRGFKVVERVFVKDKIQLEKTVEKIGLPLVMKVSGKEIVHKNRVGGVVTGIDSLENASKIFDKLMKIKGANGIMIQKQIHGKEVLLGLKRTREFGHVVAFGAGGIHTEKLKDVAFRVCPLSAKDKREIIKDTKVFSELDKKDLKLIEENLGKICKLAKKYPQIKELDINPLIQGVVIDARIVI